MLLALERHVRIRQLHLLAHRDEGLGLARRDDPVLEPLEQHDRAAEPVGEVDRRAVAVDVATLGVRPDQPFVVTRLELVSGAVEELEVADAVVARAGVVEVALRQREQDGEAAGRAARDGDAVGVHLALRDEVACRIDAVVDIDHAPHPLEPLAVRAPVSCRTAVVDVDERESPARPVLVLERIRRPRVPRRAAVAVDDERRLLAGRRLEILVARRVVEGVRRLAAFGRKLDRPGHAEVAGLDVRRVGDLDDLLRQRLQVDDQDALGERRGAGVHHGLTVRDLHVVQRGVQQLDLLQPAGVEVDASELGAAALVEDAHDLVGAVEGVETLAEHPLRRAELRRAPAHRLVAFAPCAVEVPPVVAVGHEIELAGRGPLGLQHGLVGAARHLAALDHLHAQAGHREVGRAGEAVMPRADDDNVCFVHVRFKKA